MRPDVKLGVIISLALVLVAGSYYFYRDVKQEPIPLSHERAPEGRSAPKPEESRRTAETSAEKRERSVRKPPRRSPARVADRGAESKPRGTSPAKIPSSADVNGRVAPASEPPAGRTEPPAGSRINPVERPGPSTPTAADLAQSAPERTPTVTLPAQQTKPDDAAHSSVQVADSGPADRPAPPADRVLAPAQPQPVVRSARPPSSLAGPTVAVDTHRTQERDTLASLAATYYGHEKHTQFLADANPHVTDPRRLQVGTVINIPALPDSESQAVLAASTGGSLKARPAAPEGARTYLVKPGDSFYAIARSQLGDASRWEELFSLNKPLVGDDPRRLQVGQVITLPSG